MQHAESEQIIADIKPTQHFDQLGKFIAFQRSEIQRQEDEERFETQIDEHNKARAENLAFEHRCAASVRTKLNVSKYEYNQMFISKSWVKSPNRLRQYTNDTSIAKLFRITVKTSSSKKVAFLFTENGKLHQTCDLKV